MNPIRTLMLDSGAHALFGKHILESGKHIYDGKTAKENWFGTRKRLSKEFTEYMDGYTQFVNDHAECIDFYINVDVVLDPKRSYLAYKYLKQNGLSPVPVVHYNTPMKWVDKYLKDDLELLGIGGLSQGLTVRTFQKWCDQLFMHLCPKANDYKPIVRMHGFAVTSYTLLWRYPWWSVDSTSYNKMAGYGWLLIPHWNKGGWDFSRKPHQIGVVSEVTPTMRSLPKGKYDKGHFASVDDSCRPTFVSPAMVKGLQHVGPKSHPNREARRIVDRWLEYIEVPFGDNDTPGVSNTFGLRSYSNVRYFGLLEKALPEWPSQFIPPRGPSLLDLVRQEEQKHRQGSKHTPEQPRLFFAGAGAKGYRAEEVFEDANVLMSAWDFYIRKWKADKRFLKHEKERKKCKR